MSQIIDAYDNAWRPAGTSDHLTVAGADRAGQRGSGADRQPEPRGAGKVRAHAGRRAAREVSLGGWSCASADEYVDVHEIETSARVLEKLLEDW